MMSYENRSRPILVFNSSVALVLLAGLILVSPVQYIAKENPGKSYKRALEFGRKGKFEEARQELHKTLLLKPDHAKAKVLLGWVCFKIGEDLKERGDLPLALAAFKEAVAADPEEAYWHAALSDSLHKSGDAQNASRECTEAARLSPLDAFLQVDCSFVQVPDRLWRNIPGLSPQHNLNGGTIVAPLPRYRPEPPYSPKARQLQLQGSTILMIVVDQDGNVERTGVLHPLGLGLDQKALETISKWKFDPALKGGNPVKCKLVVEIQFRLY